MILKQTIIIEKYFLSQQKMAAQAKHSCMPGTSEGDHAHVSPTILACSFEVKMTLAT